MPNFADIRRQFPDAADLSDLEIVDRLSSHLNLPFDTVARDFGMPGKAEQADRSVIRGAGDFAINTGTAVLGTGKAALDFFSPGSQLAENIDRASQGMNQFKSLRSQLADRELQQAMDSEDAGTQLKGVGNYALNDPWGLAGSTIGNFVMPGTAVKGARLGATALQLGEKGIARAGLAGGSVVGGVLGGGDAAGTAYETVMNAPDLQHLPEEERRQMATDAARKASVVPAVIGLVTGATGAEAALAHGTKSILKTAGKEFLSEAAEEGATTLSANLAAGQYTDTTSPLKGVVGSAALGGLMGGGTGLAVGALTKQGSFLPGSNGNETQPTPDGTGIEAAVNGGRMGAPTRAMEGLISSAEGALDRPYREPKKTYTLDELVQRAQSDLEQKQQQVQQQQAAAQQAQTQANQQAQAAADQQAQAVQAHNDSILSQFGITTAPGDTNGQLFGQKIFGTQRLNETAQALGAVAAQTDPFKLQLLGAINQAHNETGGKLISYKFNAEKVQESVRKALEAIDKVEAKFQINHAQSVEEAAGILNALSEQAKGRELEQINAIHAALTGKDTVGYTASQISSGGTTNGQVQSAAGVGAVSEPGRASQAAGGDAGGVRSDQVGSLGAGSNALLQNTEQNVGQGETGARSAAGGTPVDAGTGAGAPASEGQVNGQLTTVPGARPETDEAGSVAVRGNVSPALRQTIDDATAFWKRITGKDLHELPAPLQEAWVNATAQGKISHELANSILEQNAEKDITFAAVLPRLLEKLIVRAGPMKAEKVQKIRDLMEYILGSQTNERLETQEELARIFGLTLKDVQNYEARAKNLFKFYGDKIEKALDEIQKEYNYTSREDLMAAIARANEFNRGQESAATTEQDEVGQQFADQRVEVNQKNDEGENDSAGVQQASRKSASLAEENNAAEGISNRYIKLAEALSDLENEIASMEEQGDFDKVAELQTKKETLDRRMADLMAEAEKTNKKEARKSLSKETDDAVQEQGAGKVDVRQPAGNGETVGEENAKSEKPAGKGKPRKAKQIENKPEPQEEVTVEGAWDKVASAIPGMPKFSELSEEDQQTFKEFGPENWTRDDVILFAQNQAKGAQLDNIERLTFGGDKPSERTPSLSRGVGTLLRMRDSGKITDEQTVARVGALYDQVQTAKANKEPATRQRGADFIRQRILEAKRKGWISTQAADMAEWFILKNPALVDTLGVSFQSKKDGVSGSYSSFRRVMILVKHSSNDETAVHEILHHLERMMPAEMQNALRMSWLKSLLAAQKQAKGDANLEQFYQHLMDYHFNNGGKKSMDAAVDLLKSGKVDYDHYQHVNSSEFWTVNATRIMEGRFGVKDSIVGKIKQWLKEFVEHAKAVFGLKSDAAILKALSSVAKGDGKFKTKTMLAEGVPYNMFAGKVAAERISDAEEKQVMRDRWKRSGGYRAIMEELNKDPIETKLTDLAKAKVMEAAGQAPETIWYDTGWNRGADGDWRFELDDSKAKFKQDFTAMPNTEIGEDGAKLSDVLDHPDLFAVYPELADIKFVKRGGFLDMWGTLQGWFDDKTNTIGITPYAKDPLSTLLHEVQHWVQTKEGFAPGGNSDAVQLNNVAALQRLIRILDTAAQEGDAVSRAKTSVLKKAVERILDPKVQDDIDFAYSMKKAAAEAFEKAKAEVKQAEAEAKRSYNEALAEYASAQHQLEAEMEKIKEERGKHQYGTAEYKDWNAKFKEAMDARYDLVYPVPDYTKADAAKKVAAGMSQTVDAAKKNLDTVLKSAAGTSLSDVKYYLYKMISGEAEARNTQTRQNMPMGIRRELSPEVTTDIPSDLQTVVSRSDETVIGNLSYENIERQTNKVMEQAESTFDKMPKPLKRAVRNIWYGMFKKAPLAVMITKDVAEMARKFMKSVDKYVEANQERTQLVQAKEQKMVGIATAFQALPQDTRATVNKLIAAMTREGKWAYDPGIQGVAVDSEMKQRFDALPPAAQKVVRDVFQYGRDSLADKKAAIYAKIDEAYPEEDDPKRKEMLASFRTILGINNTMPYAPFKRYGSFVVVGKSAEYLEAERNHDAKAIDELRSDEKHYLVEFAETMGEAQEIRDDLVKQGTFKFGELQEPFEKSAYKDTLYSGTDLFKGFAKLQRIIAGERGVEGGNEVLNKLDAMVKELYLLSLAESSARKSELQRKNIAGYNPDMMRAFFTQGMADAHYIANLKTSDKSLDAMVAMQQEAGANRAESYPYLNEIMAREAQSLETRQPSMLDMANRMTANWFLTFSPGFYLQQSTQTYVMSLPWLAGKYQYFKSERALRHAYQEILPLVRDFKLGDAMSFDKLPEDVRAMLNELVGRGLINIGQEAELGQFRTEAGNKAADAWNGATNKMRGVINRIEAVNRSVAAIAAYRLEMAESGDKVKALAAADKVVHVTHGSYDGFNTPRWFNKSAIHRSVTQFRRFQIIQLSMLARMLGTAFKSASATERAVARKQFGYLMAHMMVLAGAKGLPIWGLATVVYALSKAAFGDEDDPEDLEEYLREQGGLFLVKGLPAAAGLDLSDKLGMGKVTSILPYTDVDLTTRSGLEKTALGLSGPFAGGLLPKFVDAVGLFAKGDYYRAMENALPNGFNNAVRALRFNTEGVTMRNGDVVMSPEDIGFATTTMTALGLSPTELSERMYRQNVLRKYDDFFENRAKEIKAEYLGARKDNDTGAMSDARDAWATLQQSRVDKGYTRQPVSELLKAAQAQHKREKSVIGSVETNKANRKFAQQLAGE